MGFFKKKEVSPEEQARLDAEKAVREAVRKEKSEAKEKQREIDSAARAARKEAKKAEEQAHIERFFGPDPSFEDSMNVGIYHVAIDRIKNKLLLPGEVVLATLPVEYDESGGKEVKGVLVATNQKLIYSSNSPFKEFTEIMDYKSMSSITLSNDGFLKKELHITSGREKRVFDDIKDNKQLGRLLDNVRQQIAAAHSGASSQPQVTTPSVDKYQQLEQLAKLKEQGILTDEEFGAEKSKVLNA